MEVRVEKNNIRIDKYLNDELDISRSKIQKLIEEERILVNGKTTSSSYKVKLNDEIEVIFGRRHLKVKVLAIKEVVRKNDADILYEVMDEWMDEE